MSLDICVWRKEHFITLEEIVTSILQSLYPSLQLEDGFCLVLLGWQLLPAQRASHFLVGDAPVLVQLPELADRD